MRHVLVANESGRTYLSVEDRRGNRMQSVTSKSKMWLGGALVMVKRAVN